METPDATPRPARRTLGTIGLVVFLDLVGFSIIFPLFPAMLDWYLGNEGPDSLIGRLVAWIAARTPGEDPFLTTVLFGGILGSLYSILQFLFAPIWGRLSDRIGRRRVLLVTVAGTGLSYLLWIFSEGFVLLLLARVLGGLMAGNIAVATAAVADVTSRADRAKGMGMIGMAFGLGFIVGPAIGGLATLWNPAATEAATATGLWGLHPFSLPAIFALGLSLLNWIWIWRSLPETHTPGSPEPSPTRGWIPFRHLASHAAAHAVLVYFLHLIAFSAMEFTLTFLAVERLAYSPRQLTLLFVFIGLILAFTQGWFVRRYAHRIGEVKLVLTGLLLGTLGLFALGAAETVFAFYAGLGLLGAGIGMTSPGLSALVSLYSPAGRQGAQMGAFRSAGALARAIGPLLGAALFWSLGSQWAYALGGVGLVVSLFVALFLPNPSRGFPEASPDA